MGTQTGTANSTRQHKRTETPRISSAEAKRQVTAAFVNCAVLRGAAPSKDALKLYTERLAQEPIEDVLLALEKLGEMPKKEFESAVPEIGAILALVHTCTLARQNRAEVAKSQRLVRWRCDACKLTVTGFPASNDALDRRCYRKVWDQKQEQSFKCGTQMTVIHDDSQKADAGPMEHYQMPAWMSRKDAH